MQLNYEHSSDTVGAEAASLELLSRVVTFKVKLKPVDLNQAFDADRCREKGFKDIVSFSFHDAYIWSGLASFWKYNKSQFDACRVEIDYGQKYTFACEIEAMKPDRIKLHIRQINPPQLN
tara:strand:- start:34039 stop:34398 length:360 start_codon:yes stop_codon:yes gene_type:complete